MFSLSRLLAAVASLAQSVEALAGSVGEANANFRQRLALDAPDPVPAPPALEHDPHAHSGSAGGRRKREVA